MFGLAGTWLRIWPLAILLLITTSRENAGAQAQCVTFSEARKLGLSKLKSASDVKSEVEKSTGGKVVKFLVCKAGPTYQLTVIAPGGAVSMVEVPAR